MSWNQKYSPYQKDKDSNQDFKFDVNKRSDRLINYFLIGFCLASLYFAKFYDTWGIALGVSGLSLTAYYSTKWFLPKSNLYQYVLSVCLGLFMALFIFQMHGMFEMHFFAFIGGALLITYQNWKLQIPILLFVIVHHIGLNYLQSIGYGGVYFTTLDYMGYQTMSIHLFLTTVIYFVCGLWAYNLDKYDGVQYSMRLQIEERRKNQETLEVLNEELRLSNQEAVKAIEVAKKAVQAKSIFLATMSHEIRTPMNGVMGMTSMLMNTKLSEEQTDYINVIDASTEALLSVINDILDFSKIESGHMNLNEHSFDLHKCVEDVIDLFAGKSVATGINLYYEIDPSLPELIITDSVRLRQVLINLLNNALKFTDEGEVYLKIYPQERSEENVKITFEVRDTGIGISQTEIPRLFKPFSQVDSSSTRKFGGTGLGLVISQRLVNLMKGSIEVDSEEGKGSLFSFTIEAGMKPLQQATSVPDTFPDQGEKSILLLDSHQTNQRILKTQLEAWKFSATVADTENKALELLSSDHAFHLVIMDDQIPDAIKLIKKIKAKTPQLPIVLLSAKAEGAKKGTRDLLFGVLHKPAKNKQLLKLIYEALNYLPKEPAPHANDKKIMPAEGFSDLYPLEILLAEDNMINIKLIGTVFGKLGYTIDVVHDGYQAYKKSEQKEYDLILMDVLMPELDGLEATAKIRALPGKQPVIIALTANAMPGDKDKCMEAGMDDYLTKPINLEQLISSLKRVHQDKVYLKPSQTHSSQG